MKKTIILLFLIYITSACLEIKHEYITIINETDYDILIQDRIFNMDAEEDTLFNCIKQFIPIYISKNSTIKYDCGRYCDWSILLNTNYVQFIVIDKDIYEQYHKEPCDTVRKYVPILHRYKLTLADLERMNGTVVYPPKEVVDE